MDEWFSGAAYVVFGLPGARESFVLSISSTVDFVTLLGASYSWLGYSVSGAGILLLSLVYIDALLI